jgi:hypothetical protein
MAMNQCIYMLRKQVVFSKFWLLPIELDYSKGMKTNDIRIAEEIIVRNLEIMKEKWNNVFGY